MNYLLLQLQCDRNKDSLTTKTKKNNHVHTLYSSLTFVVQVRILSTIN